MKKTLMLVVLVALVAVPMLAHAWGVFYTRTNVHVVWVKMLPGSSDTCEINYTYSSGILSSAVVAAEAGSEAMCSALMTAMLNDSEIVTAQLYVFKEAGGDEEVIWYGVAGTTMGY